MFVLILIYTRSPLSRAGTKCKRCKSLSVKQIRPQCIEDQKATCTFGIILFYPWETEHSEERRGACINIHAQSRSEHKSLTGPLYESVTAFSSSQLSAIRRKRNNALEQVANLLNAYGSCNAWSDVKAFMLKEWCLIVVVYHHFHTCDCRQEWDVILLLCSQDKGKSCKPKKREAYNGLFWAKIGIPLCLEFSALIKLLS